MHTSHIPLKELKLSDLKVKKPRAASRGNSKDYRTTGRNKPVFKMVRRVPAPKRKNKKKAAGRSEIEKPETGSVEVKSRKKNDYQSNALRFSNVDGVLGSKMMSMPQSKEGLLSKKRKVREKKTRGKSAAYQSYGNHQFL